jgi:1-phosphatidylinositol-3-phosphate 5-kinase
MELLHVEVSKFLHHTENKIVNEDDPVKEVVQRRVIEMKDLLKMERNEYEVTQSDCFPYSLHDAYVTSVY